MKKGAFVLAVIMILSFTVISAQNPNRERLDSYKIAFFTQKLKLTSSEAEKFWPVYNDFQSQKNKLQIEKISLMRLFNQGESTMNDNQITELGNKYCEIIVRESELALIFHKKLQEILPPAKVLRVYQAENQYRVQLLNELQDRRGERLNQN